MTKIMLVEDDKSLREIYGVRLLAEGYEIISAGDGEEALAMAVKEKPDLILSDVMMPKISGFDMLDILRSTPETKDIKVIMMTALSSEDQRSRGETLGANRYLVKSQVGIEDVVRTVHDVLNDIPVVAAPAAQKFGNPVPTEVVKAPIAPTPQPPVEQAPVPEPVSEPAPMPTPPLTSPEPATPVEPVAQTPPTPASTPMPPQPQAIPVEPAATPVPELVAQPMPEPIAPPAPMPPPTPAAPVVQPVQTPPAPVPTLIPPQPQAQPTRPISAPTPTPDVHLPEPTAPFSTAAPASLAERVINPPEPTEEKQDIQTLISQELELNDGSNTQPQPPVGK